MRHANYQLSHERALTEGGREIKSGKSMGSTQDLPERRAMQDSVFIVSIVCIHRDCRSFPGASPGASQELTRSFPGACPGASQQLTRSLPGASQQLTMSLPEAYQEGAAARTPPRMCSASRPRHARMCSAWARRAYLTSGRGAASWSPAHLKAK